MKRRSVLSLVSVIAFILFVSGSVLAQSSNTNQIKNQIKSQLKLQDQNQLQNKIHGSHFIDNNNDGYNDNAPDADGDGIPNGQDPDYTRPLDGTGSKFKGDRSGFGYGYKRGSGVCDGTGPKGFRRNGK